MPRTLFLKEAFSRFLHTGQFLLSKFALSLIPIQKIKDFSGKISALEGSLERAIHLNEVNLIPLLNQEIRPEITLFNGDSNGTRIAVFTQVGSGFRDRTTRLLCYLEKFSPIKVLRPQEPYETVEYL